jgi:hypothetical protein
MRVRLVDRVARVVLERIAPELLQSLARPPARGWRSGLILAVHHPEIGAGRARDLGLNECVCSLVQRHETPEAQESPSLSALQRADSAC